MAFGMCLGDENTGNTGKAKTQHMLQNYFKIAWRNLFRNKAFSLTNLLGLGIGVVILLLTLFIVSPNMLKAAMGNPVNALKEM
jgi:hypothetical protein